MQALTRLKIDFADEAPVDVPKRVLGGGATVFAMAAVVDKKKLQAERNELERYITTLRQRIKNDDFHSRAPATVVSKEKERLREAEERLRQL